MAASIAAMAKILFVDDDDAVRTITARALERAGHVLELAADGEAGLASIVASGGAFDLVVSDIRMPEMDGIAMAKAAASRYPGLKIILITGYADQRERPEDLAGAVVDVVQKPFTLAEIKERIGRALG